MYCTLEPNASARAENRFGAIALDMANGKESQILLTFSRNRAASREDEQRLYVESHV
jgi:hypothetical protein